MSTPVHVHALHNVNVLQRQMLPRAYCTHKLAWLSSPNFLHPPPSPSMEKPLAPMVAHGHVAALLYNTLDAGRQARTHISFSHTSVFTLFSGIWRSSSFIANSLRSQSWFSFLKYPLHSRITLLLLCTRLEIHMCIIKQFTRPQWHRT